MEFDLLTYHSSWQLFRAPWPKWKGEGPAVVPEDDGRRALNLLGAWRAGHAAVGDGSVSVEIWPQP